MSLGGVSQATRRSQPYASATVLPLRSQSSSEFMILDTCQHPIDRCLKVIHGRLPWFRRHFTVEGEILIMLVDIFVISPFSIEFNTTSQVSLKIAKIAHVTTPLSTREIIQSESYVLHDFQRYPSIHESQNQQNS
ncbi:hypothetical protein Hanom_Chr11g01052151 [Helianthus anomalus]